LWFAFGTACLRTVLPVVEKNLSNKRTNNKLQLFMKNKKKPEDEETFNLGQYRRTAGKKGGFSLGGRVREGEEGLGIERQE